MAERIELPQAPNGTAEEQLKQMYSYLYRVAQALNHNLSEIGSMDLTDEERLVMQQITAEDSGDTAAGYDWQGKESLKSLIIKTAAFVQNALDSYRLNLLGEYVAEGKFGRYVRNTGLKVDVTPTGIQQDFTFEEVVQGLKTYTINAKNYIKTGLLRTVQSIPVYGVAIGKDVVTFAEDGTETYNDGNKVAELTADELSFYQGGDKVASYTGNKISFLMGGTEVFYIQSGKIHSNIDLELSSGKKLIINTTNFKVDSSGNVEIIGTIKAGSTFAGTMSAGCITSGTMSADRISGGTIDASQTTVKNLDASKITTGTMSANKISGGSIDASNVTINNLDASKITTGTMSANKISGGTLTLGGNNNTNGKLVMKNASNSTIGEWDNDGFSASGGTFDVNYDNFKISSSNGHMVTKTNNMILAIGNTSETDYPGERYFAKFIPTANILGNEYIRDITLSINDTMTLSGYAYNTLINFGTFWMHDEFDNQDKIVAGIDLFRSYKKNISTSAITDIDSGIERDLAKFQRLYAAQGKIDALVYTVLQQQSSRDIKHDIQDMPEMGGQLDELRPVTFVYDDDPAENKRYGLIYEDTAEVMPEICTGDESNKAINYVELIPMLLKEIQDLRQRVKQLEEREGN